SENIHEHLPALRSAVRSTLDRVRVRFAERRATYKDSLHSVLRGIEATPEWSRLESDDREEIARKVSPDSIPEIPTAGREIAGLRLILARESNINALRSEVENEIQRRVPAPPPQPETKEPPTEETVGFADLMVPEVIRTRDDLEAWLSSMRTQLDELLRSNKF